MRRREALIVGGAVAVALAIPPILRRQTSAFEFSRIPNPPGFRRLVRGSLSGSGDLFAGLLTPEEEAATDRLPGNLCTAIYPQSIVPKRLPIAVFSDYYCPYCAVLDKRLADLVASGSPIDLVFHELPLLGERSVWASRVALAGGMQGDHTAIHLDMMQRVLRPGIVGVRDVAERHGLDAQQMMDDAMSPEMTVRIEEALALGRALGIPGTPGMVVGRTVVVGALPAADLAKLIELEREIPFTGCA
ncbi:DsbA family protein [uncultured Roseobacter sp.]|uniref:DsbA family protein n=1 Tax=uncultured Roseobacter sp. TaxID=114847 RepID=UPI0026246ACA|nr:DsbA family protein [uncultured Roseobacter sp.]